MSLAYRVLFATVCKNTHHRLALDALRLLRGPQADAWRDVFLTNYVVYLQGSKAPDDTFKDFQNHVLHVRDNYWGGALKAGQTWYARALDALRRGDIQDGVFSAGVLSHYVTDPFMPFHTGQTEEEGKVHRAVEWSIAKSYVELQNIIEQDLGGYPTITAGDGPGWQDDLVRQGAEAANADYELLIDHYNLAVGVKDPPRGLDQEMKDRIARRLAEAAATVACIFDRLFEESKLLPPPMSPSVPAIIASSLTPIYALTKKLADVKDRIAVEAVYQEVQLRGKATSMLPEDDRVVRKLYAEQVLKIPLRQLDAQKPKPTGTKHGQGAPPRQRSNQARILMGMPTMRMPAVRMPKLAVPKMSMPKLGMPKMTMPSLASAKESLSKLKMPKLSVPKLSLGSLKMPNLSLRKSNAEAPVEESPPLKTAVDSPPRPLMKTDLDVRRDEPTVSRRVDPPAKQAPPPNDKPSPAGGEALKFHLQADSPVEAAPSIGAKTARRLNDAGIKTVSDLLNARPETLARKLNVSHIDADVIDRWQKQAVLCCRVPNLRGHDAQMIVGCGVDDPEALADQTPGDLLDEVERFLGTPDGERALRGSPQPDLDETADWIRWARKARPLQLA